MLYLFVVRKNISFVAEAHLLVAELLDHLRIAQPHTTKNTRQLNKHLWSGTFKQTNECKTIVKVS